MSADVSLPEAEELPTIQLPVFRAQVIDDEGELDLDSVHSDAEEDTKKSFDFTGELAKLNESGGSDRRSFIEQVESAFKTPAKIAINFGESFKEGALPEFGVFG